MRCQIIAELATNHGGDLQLAKDMIAAAADAGADIVKVQAYQIKHLRRTDPQYDWFKQCALTDVQVRTLCEIAEYRGVGFLATAYAPDDLRMLQEVACQTRVKIGSGEGRSDMVARALDLFETVYATLPWGDGRRDLDGVCWFATVPLYPTPPECYARVTRQEGWSDHAIGLDLARMAIMQGARFVEKHFHLPGRGRNQDWNMTPDDLGELRRWTEVCAQATDGTKFEGRWCA